MLCKPECRDLSKRMVLNISKRLYWVAGVLSHNAPGGLVIVGTDGGLHWHLNNTGMELDYDI